MHTDLFNSSLQVESLTRRWQKAEHHIQKLEQVAAVRDDGILQLEGYLEQLRDQHEVSTAAKRLVMCSITAEGSKGHIAS